MGNGSSGKNVTPYYQDALVTLYHGEAFKIMSTMPDSSVDAVVTDPPYSSGGAFRSDRVADTNRKYVNGGTKREYTSFCGDNRDQRSYMAWCTLWLSECFRIAKPGAICMTFSDWRQLSTWTDIYQAGGFVLRGIAVWDKTPAARPFRGGFRNQAEFILWGSKGAMDLRDDSPYLPGVFTEIVRQADKFHMTGKPTRLMAELVKVVPSGGVVLDPFMGSGTTGVACRAAGLGFIGIEQHPEIFETARERVIRNPLQSEA